MKTAKRLNDFEAYLGTAMNLILTKMKEEGKDVINLGLGDPDVIPPEHMRKALSEACYDPDNHHYPSFYSPMPLLKENDFLPDLEAISPEIAQAARMIWVNYPNNPTAAHAPGDFYFRLVEWAQKHDVIVVSDNPYSEICFDGYCAPSFLQVPGAKEVGIEFNSLSKAFNACGWRTGFMVGNAEIIAGMAKIKSHSDRGMFYPLQVAAITALNGTADFMEQRNQMYQERRDVVVAGLQKCGIGVESPKGTFYIWAPLPEGVSNSKEWCFKVLDEIAVWMIPGSMYGKCGEGYFRIALTHPTDRLAEAMSRLKIFFGN